MTSQTIHGGHPLIRKMSKRKLYLVKEYNSNKSKRHNISYFPFLVLLHKLSITAGHLRIATLKRNVKARVSKCMETGMFHVRT